MGFLTFNIAVLDHFASWTHLERWGRLRLTKFTIVTKVFGFQTHFRFKFRIFSSQNHRTFSNHFVNWNSNEIRENSAKIQNNNKTESKGCVICVSLNCSVKNVNKTESNRCTVWKILSKFKNPKFENSSCKILILKSENNY